MPRKLARSFEFAFLGIKYLLTTQRNMRIHLIIAVGVVITSILLKVSLVEHAVIVVCIFLVLITEMLNTAIEEAINLLIKKHNLHAKLAKDISAAATLFAGICAIIVGCLVLGPRLLAIIW